MTHFPHFIIIGAGKCGTTSLHNYLNQHPDIYLCPKKETFFFIDPEARQKNQQWGAVTTLEEYLALFAEAPDRCIRGEISTVYHASPESAGLIQQAIPRVKIIAILRNPIDRAFSSYQMFVRDGQENRSFAEVIATRNQHVNRGFYSQQLQPFYQHFPADNIKILFFEDLVKDSQAFLTDLFQFVDVNPNFLPDTSQRSREGGLPQKPWLHQLLTQDNPLRSTAASLLKTVLPLEKRQKLRNRLVKGNISKEKLDPETRAVLRDLYREDIQQLEALLDRDLSHWLA